MSTRSEIVAGVFAQEEQAEQALKALEQAGFIEEQLGVAAPTEKHIDLLSALRNLDVPTERANYYAQEFSNGRTVVSVRPDGRTQEALAILRRYGAEDYDQSRAPTQTETATSEMAEQSMTAARGDTAAPGMSVDNIAASQRGMSASDIDEQRATAGQGGVGMTDQTLAQGRDAFQQRRSLKLREEQLAVDKERVQTGEAKLHKEVVTEQKTIDVPVSREEMVIERRSLSGDQVDAAPIGEGETIRVPLSEEKVNINKETVVTGEVAIGKQFVQDKQRVTETTRREEPLVEHEGDVSDLIIHDTNPDAPSALPPA
ncbi:YsnF/AvaK domain-containing protein [Dictyobacter arantiisoli]|uniref:DUF2382 domain-containing protein n=1 Tax=Dictyobacter arantiisoli TaxID=2014874 RepID=A0A5A5TH26_9CHLR|nr:YsnF/AvaK domain-containing protein [Dictyobacter arantiisoli]GCF10456.1 hypothetical protein KDI_40200 [Dictyobacter arantiisoli]